MWINPLILRITLIDFSNMYFEKIRLVQFRNFNDQTIHFSSRVNVFVGDNGQGKTNIIEALYYSVTGDTFRYGDNHTLINQNHQESLIQAQILQNELNFQIKTILLKSRKNIFLNNKKISSTELQKNFSCIVFSPESLSSIKEGADLRRQLIDELITTFDKKNSEIISDYKKVLKTRNKILKNLIEGKEKLSTTKELIESIEPSFLRLATQLTKKRIEAINAIQQDFNNAMQYISSTENEQIGVQYLISGENALTWNETQIYNALQKRLSELESAELGHGSSLVGPQKHDIVFLYGEKDSRFYCSQGQQRAIILSFKMAQIVYHRKVHGQYPVLMLDDVLSELDKKKREALIRFLHDINTQIFITTTDFNLPEHFQLDGIAVKTIQGGTIQS